MTTASKITLVRVAMIPIFMALLLLGYRWIALAVFILASVTDFVDGYVARHYNQVSDFGKFLDPLADKLLVTAVGNGRVIAAGWSGKVKTFSTMVGLCLMMAFPIWWLDWVVTAVITLTTLYCGVEYFVKNWDVIRP